MLGAALLVVGCGPRAEAGDPTPAIGAMLERSATAWNRGDLDAFVSDYLADSTPGFVQGGTVHYGIAWIRENYRPRFEPGAERDSLRFESVVSRPLGEGYALATARYVLHRGDSVTSSGPFTLVLYRSPEGWKILHDHTSSDPR